MQIYLEYYIMQDTEEKTTSSDRPPMDIFKAVFGNSDDDQSSSSSDEDDNEEEKAGSLTPQSDPVIPQSDPVIPRQNVLDILGTTQNSGRDNPFSRLFACVPDANIVNSRKSDSTDSAVLVIDGSHIEDITSPGNSSEKTANCVEDRLSLHTADDKTSNAESQNLDDMYGPALPPRLGCENTGEYIQISINGHSF
jgi:hypothetical protein